MTLTRQPQFTLANQITRSRIPSTRINLLQAPVVKIESLGVEIDILNNRGFLGVVQYNFFSFFSFCFNNGTRRLFDTDLEKIPSRE